MPDYRMDRLPGIHLILSDSWSKEWGQPHRERDAYYLSADGRRFGQSGEVDRRTLFGQKCQELDVFNRFVDKVNSAGAAGISSREAAGQVVQELQIELAETTVYKLGLLLANWAEYAGIVSRRGRLCIMGSLAPEQMRLF